MITPLRGHVNEKRYALRSITHTRAASQHGKDRRNATKKITQNFSADRLAVPRSSTARETLSQEVDNPPLALQPGKPAVLKWVLKWVLNRCLKRYKAVQKCDNFRTPGWCLNGRFLGEYGSAPGETRTPDPLLRRQLDYLLN